MLFLDSTAFLNWVGAVLFADSMGGAIAVRVAAKRALPTLAGLVVIDVVEVSLDIFCKLCSHVCGKIPEKIQLHPWPSLLCVGSTLKFWFLIGIGLSEIWVLQSLSHLLHFMLFHITTNLVHAGREQQWLHLFTCRGFLRTDSSIFLLFRKL